MDEADVFGNEPGLEPEGVLNDFVTRAAVVVVRGRR